MGSIRAVSTWTCPFLGRLLSRANATFTTVPVDHPSVSGNRSLDEFGAPEDVEEPTAADDGVAEAESIEPEPATEDGAEAATASAADAGDPDPPASTYVWRPEGGLCDSCGERAVERWRDGGALVCGACKEW